MKLSPKEIICLKYLSDKMEATAQMCGQAIGTGGYPFHKSWAGVGMLRRLRNLGLVYRLPELKAWCLTKEGRELVRDGK